MPRNALTERTRFHSTPSAAGDTPGPWTQPRFVVSALVLALIAALGIGMALIPDGDPKPAPPAADASAGVAAPAAPAVPVADPAASACGLPAGDQKVPTAAPKTTRWELVGTAAVPTAPKQLGPGKVTAGLRTCFAHSPTGALYAAVSLLAMTNIPELRGPAVTQLAANGEGRDAALAKLARDKQPSRAEAGVQVAGFNVLNYDSASTLVELVLRVDTGGLARLPLTMRWEAGDWKVVIAPGGDLGRGLQPVPNLNGYLSWSGV